MMLTFRLPVRDGWPPVSVECLPVTKVAQGYRVEAAPFFVKGLSSGDVLSVSIEGEEVIEFEHVERSKRTTLWLMSFDDGAVRDVLASLRKLDCNTEELAEFAYFTIDVPQACPLELVERHLETLSDNQAAIAFSSLRHEE